MVVQAEPPAVRRRYPSLELRHCDERILLSVSLVSVNAAGNGASELQQCVARRSIDRCPLAVAPGQFDADGTRLVFASQATDLVSSVNATGQAGEVYVRDLATGQTSLVSATPDGQAGNGDSFDPVISPDGRYVAFLSQATNLTAITPPPLLSIDPSGEYLYVRDLQTQTTILLDQTPGGQASDGSSTGQFVFSPDSKYLAFIDTSDNLTGASVDPSSGSNASSGWTDSSSPRCYVYVRDLAGNTTSLVSVSTKGLASGSSSFNLLGSPTDLVFSPDSQSLVFGSTATDLTANPADDSTASFPQPLVPSGYTNLFLRNLFTGTTTLLSVTPGGQLAAGDSNGRRLQPRRPERGVLQRRDRPHAQCR